MDLARDEANGQEVFSHQGMTVESGAVIHIPYGMWKGDHTSLPLQIDVDHDGVIDQNMEVTDDDMVNDLDHDLD